MAVGSENSEHQTDADHRMNAIGRYEPLLSIAERCKQISGFIRGQTQAGDMRYRVPIAVLLLAIGVAVGPSLASAVVASATDGPVTIAGDPVTNTTTNESVSSTNETAPTLGSKMSAFMQSSTVSADASVESGMWKAGVARANASTARDAVERRTASLERRLQELRTRLAALENESVDVRNPNSAATVSRLAARIQALERSINETGETARSIGVNTTRLETLRSQASNMSGHEVASIARNLSGGPPPGVQRGPPVEPPGRSNGSDNTGPNGPNGPVAPSEPNGATAPGTNGSTQGANGTMSTGPNRTKAPAANGTTQSTGNETAPGPSGGDGKTPGQGGGMAAPSSSESAANETRSPANGNAENNGPDRNRSPTGIDTEPSFGSILADISLGELAKVGDRTGGVFTDHQTSVGAW
ncbi:putative component of type IV pili like system [Halorhabdus sp. BNX81]|nr:putative component of type IV pili like system [Halorhabdus sp. BNX81]